MLGKVTRVGAAGGAATDPLFVPAQRVFSISVSGTFVATVKLQRKFSDETVWNDVKSYTAPAEEIGETGEDTSYRLLISSYTSGTVNMRLSYGD